MPLGYSRHIYSFWIKKMSVRFNPTDICYISFLVYYSSVASSSELAGCCSAGSGAPFTF